MLNPALQVGSRRVRQQQLHGMILRDGHHRAGDDLIGHLFGIGHLQRLAQVACKCITPPLFSQPSNDVLHRVSGRIERQPNRADLIATTIVDSRPEIARRQRRSRA